MCPYLQLVGAHLVGSTWVPKGSLRPLLSDDDDDDDDDNSVYIYSYNSESFNIENVPKMIGARSPFSLLPNVEQFHQDQWS